MKNIGTLGFYIEQTSKYPRFSQEEELKLIAKAQRGDKTALEDLIKANLWFIVHLVKRYYLNNGLEDHIQNGNLGLIRAIETYNPLRHTHKNKKPKLLRYHALGYIINSIYGGLPSEYRLKGGFIPISIDKELHEDRKPLTLKLELRTDFKTPEELELADEKRKTIALLNHLNEKDKEIITKHYGIGYPRPCSLQEIGKTLGISKQAVHQAESKALEKLREKVKIKKEKRK